MIVENDDAGFGLAPEHEVFRDAQCGYQHEMLVDNADAGGDSVAGRPAGYVSPIHFDATRIRFHETAEYAHQRRFASAILSDQGVDLAGHHVERCTSVCTDGTE